MRESRRALLEKNDKWDEKPFWFYTWEVDQGSHFLGMTTYGEIKEAKEGLAYGVH